MERYQFVLKYLSVLIKKLYLFTFLKTKYPNVLYPQHIYFDMSKVNNILILINKVKDSTSVIVERDIFSFYQVNQSNICNHKNVL